MPKMTRRDFTDARDRIWVQAIDNFEHSGYLAPVLIGFTPKGEEHMWMGMKPPAPDAPDTEHAHWAEEVRKAERAGIHLLTGAWRDNIDHLRAEVDLLGIVAAIHVDEAWIARDALAHEVTALGMTTGEHPMKEEAALCHASWPREYVSSMYLRIITRDDHGRPYLVEAPDTTGMDTLGWLDQVLPPPPGKKRPERHRPRPEAATGPATHPRDGR